MYLPTQYAPIITLQPRRHNVYLPTQYAPIITLQPRRHNVYLPTQYASLSHYNQGDIMCTYLHNMLPLS